MLEHHFSWLLPQPVSEVRTSYPLEARREEIWRDLVNKYAPSLQGKDPSRVIEAPHLPVASSIDVAEERKKISSEIRNKKMYWQVVQRTGKPPEGIAALVAAASRRRPADSADIHWDFLTRAMQPAIEESPTLGLHYRSIDLEKGGVIFLPTETPESRNWAMLYNLAKVLGQEGHGMLLTYFPETLSSLADDISKRRSNPTVKQIEDKMGEDKYAWLVRQQYTPIFDRNAQNTAAGIVLASSFKNFGHLEPSVRDQVTKVLGSVDRLVSSQPDSKNRARKVDLKIKEVACLLNCSIVDARAYANLTIGLSTTVKMLHKWYPHDLERSKQILAALTYLDMLNGHPVQEAREGREPDSIRSVVSRQTLRKIREEINRMRGEEKELSDGAVQGMSDGVLSHELLHGLLVLLIAQEKSSDDPSLLNILDDEENVVEAMNFSRHRDTVVRCKYYNRKDGSKKRIVDYHDMFFMMIPEEREAALRQYVRTGILEPVAA